MSFGKGCGVGDRIQTTLSDGRVLVMTLDTREAAAYGSYLVETGRWIKCEEETDDGE